MLKLKKIDLKEFKKDVYDDYCLLFPKEERKNYMLLKKNYSDKILNIYKIEDDEEYIGFMMFNSIYDSKILQFDYFGIKPQYQSMGYGSKAIKLLKNYMIDYDCIYGEVEKLGLGITKEENNLRKKRVKFYENLGFYKLNCDLELYKVIYTPICLVLNKKMNDEKIIDDAFKIYNSILGEYKTKRNCKIIKQN